jgi:endonuclease YncB( thermonuclease family)
MYSRYLGVLYSDSYNINEKLLEEGYAKEYKDRKPAWEEKDFDKIIQIGG